MNMRLLLATLLGVLAAVCQAQPRPTRVLVPFAPGGASDVYTRMATSKITELTGKTFVVENRTGAGGRIAWEAAAKAPADGGTIVLIDATYPMLPGLFDKLAWDASSDLVPVALIAQTPFLIVASPQSKLTTLRALVAEARARPSKLNYGSAGIGSVTHIVAALFLHNARIEVTHIPYKGMSDVSAALQGGQVDLMIAATPTALGAIRSGKAAALALSSTVRSPALPDVPTALESGVDYVVFNWFGFAVPKGTPKAMIDTLRDDVVRAMNTPDVNEKLVAQGAQPGVATADQFAAFLREETRRWTELIRASGIKVEQ
jgi:tripartite-type tricarboxylate transporter receptor subunit TctC